ncbi:sensor histidine kinase [Carboxylicivirga sp. RSCT41]|uniref:sensor histidine kinase n=1 Tax=Carboxylicivirga agarovorans TaxID=3417570 RepID=UPI003D353C81
MSKNDKHPSLLITEHLIFATIWLFIFAAPVIFTDNIDVTIWKKLFGTWLRLLPFLGLSLINHFVLVPLLLFKRKRWLYFFTGILCTFAFVILTNYIIPKKPENNRRPPEMHQPMPGQQGDRRMPPPHRPQAREKGPEAIPPQVNSFILAFLILGFDSGLRTVFRWTRLEKEQEILEKEKVKSELAFLRNQVSPHFFMNTLNNIHSLIDLDTEEAKDSIIRLSKLMRHLLYDSNAERIPINREVDFIRNYIDLMKLRFSDKVDIQLNISEPMPDALLPPLLFTSYVENAFKHGISYQHESFIYINIHFINNELEFSIRNSNHPSNTIDEPSGIGTENSRKRLDILYGKEYKLHEESTSEHYLIKLTLPL